MIIDLSNKTSNKKGLFKFKREFSCTKFYIELNRKSEIYFYNKELVHHINNIKKKQTILVSLSNIINKIN